MSHFGLLLLSVVSLCMIAGVSADSFLEAAQTSCFQSKLPLPCFKYKGLRFLHNLATAQHRSLEFGPFRIVSLAKDNVDNRTTTFLSRAAQTNGQESEFLQVLKYGARQIDVFLRSHGITVPLPSFGESGPSLIYDDGTQTNAIFQETGSSKGRGKNHAILFPMLIITKLIVIKSMLIPLLLAILFIKKTIIFTVMALPTIISKLRTCKLIPHHFHVPLWNHHHHGHEIHDDYTPDYKEWNIHRRRNGRYK